MHTRIEINLKIIFEVLELEVNKLLCVIHFTITSKQNNCKNQRHITKNSKPPSLLQHTGSNVMSFIFQIVHT